MSRLGTWRQALPDTLFARIVIVLMLNLGLVWAVALLLVELNTRLGPLSLPYVADRVFASVQTLNSVAAGRRHDVAQAITGPGFVVRFVAKGQARPAPADDEGEDDQFVTLLKQRVRQQLPPDAAVPDIWPYQESGESGHDKASTHTIRVAFPLEDGSCATFHIRLTTESMRWFPVLGLAVSICVIVSVLSLLFARSFSRRLAAFAQAADAIGRSGQSPMLPELGPREIRLATHAFNQMQSRLRRFIRDRTQMLAAMSHDLRTPLTRLRLRAEFIEEGEQRRKMLADIAEMEAMIKETLAFARDDAAREVRRREHLECLLDDLCERMREGGHEVAFEPAEPVVVELSPVAMRRALGNLLDNAVKYGKRARVALARIQHNVVVTIDDEGPGIPAELQEHVFQPFQRLDASRNRDTGGVGLGLSVARTIIRGHGGDIVIANRESGGLHVAVTLPA